MSTYEPCQYVGCQRMEPIRMDSEWLQVSYLDKGEKHWLLERIVPQFPIQSTKRSSALIKWLEDTLHLHLSVKASNQSENG